LYAKLFRISQRPTRAICHEDVCPRVRVSSLDH
jgi:hypothetical protein